MRKISRLAETWWDYTTLDEQIMRDAAQLSEKDLLQLSRPGFKVIFHETLEEFYLAEALQYIEAWKQSTAAAPAGICGPIGPTEQLPLVAQLVNSLEINLKNCHFWGMDEWYEHGTEVPDTHPLSFVKANRDLLFNKIKPELRMPEENIHYPLASNLAEYTKSFDEIRCVTMQGGQGDAKHWAFNDPLKRSGAYADAPPTAEEYRQLSARIVDLHPITLMQNARTSGGGYVVGVPMQATTVGPVETWKAERVSIWQAGNHDNPFGMRLTAFMISKGIVDTAVPMSLLADHPNVEFHYYRKAIKSVDTEMH
ncbi:glucosamine-6-phosphate isomerase [Sphingobacterium humi]|uniref:Glucosamine-6-phosphate isomerase n=1 Tax=Sphingobacterium humi TaxID=1796905 RepID=A0A6N8L3N3_9SPHI|nr:glucosamine-6-phosphate isomerase [Sphingobacterium humi]MVZ63907.1 glucosamine-6-phosphate isomerase [Sphingobacterium humi]